MELMLFFILVNVKLGYVMRYIFEFIILSYGMVNLSFTHIPFNSILLCNLEVNQ